MNLRKLWDEEQKKHLEIGGTPTGSIANLKELRSALLTFDKNKLDNRIFDNLIFKRVGFWIAEIGNKNLAERVASSRDKQELLDVLTADYILLLVSKAKDALNEGEIEKATALYLNIRQEYGSLSKTYQQRVYRKCSDINSQIQNASRRFKDRRFQLRLFGLKLIGILLIVILLLSPVLISLDNRGLRGLLEDLQKIAVDGSGMITGHVTQEPTGGAANTIVGNVSDESPISPAQNPQVNNQTRSPTLPGSVETPAYTPTDNASTGGDGTSKTIKTWKWLENGVRDLLGKQKFSSSLEGPGGIKLNISGKGWNKNWKFNFTDSQGNPAPELTEGDRYTFNVEFKGAVKSIKFRDLKIGKNVDLGYEEVSANKIQLKDKVVAKSFAIDPTKLDFSGGVVTSTALGTELYKCKEWDFAAQTCQGIWVKQMDIIPGREYTFDISQADPGYAETGVASINTRKSLYSPGENAEIIIVVLDRIGHLAAGVNVSLEILDPLAVSSQYSTDLGTIKETERGIYVTSYSSTLTEGDYSMRVYAKGQDVDSSMFSYFTVSSSHEFEILRNTPITTDPWLGPLQSTIRIVSNYYAGSFSLTEILPMEFTASDYGDATKTIANNSIMLTWSGLTNGSSVSYSARPPLASPDLYNLGPARVSYGQSEFIEARPWYLAVDPADNGKINRVYSGGAKLTAINQTVLIGNSVNMSSSILFFSVAQTPASGTAGHVTGMIRNTTHLMFTEQAAPNMNLTWYVAEFTSGVTVIRGRNLMGNAAEALYPIGGSVNASSSFLIPGGYANSGTTWGNDDIVRYRLYNATHVGLYSAGATTPADDADWQVVQFEGATVQRNNFTFAAGASNFNVTISSIDLSRSFIISSNGASGDLANNGNSLRVTFTNATLIRFDRDKTVNTLYVGWEVVQLPVGNRVQYGTQQLSVGTPSANIALQAINLNKSVAFSSSAALAGLSIASDNTSVNSPGTGMFTHNLTSSTNLQVIRSMTGSRATEGWMVIEFSSDVYSPAVISLNYPANGANLTQSTINFNFTAIDDNGINNCSLYMNVSGWAIQGTATNVPNNTNVNITKTLSDGLYVWSIQCFDTAPTPNSGWYPSNYSLKLDTAGPVTSIDSPQNFTYIPLSSSTYTLTASATDALSNIDTMLFYYRRNATETWTAACTDTSSPYACEWSLSGLSTGNYYQIRAYANDSLGNIGLNDTHTNITLSTPPNVSSLNYPADGASLRLTQVDFNFTVIDNLPPISNCTLWGNFSPGGTWAANKTIFNVANNTNTNITLNLGNGLYKWNINCFDSGGDSAWYASNYTVRLDTVGPIIALDYPRNFTNISLSLSVYTVNASVSDTLSGIDTVLFHYRRNATEPWTVACTDTSFPYACDWSIAGFDASRFYQVRAYANDTLGNIGANYTSTNITLTPVPNVTLLYYPSDGASLRSTQVDFNFTVIDDYTPIANCTLWGNFSPSGTWAANKTLFNVANNTRTNITLTLPNGLYLWDVQCMDSSGGAAWYLSNYTVKLDTAGPTTTLDNPQSFVNISGSAGYTVNGSAADTLSSIDTVLFYYRKNDSDSWQAACSDTTFPYACEWNTISLTYGRSYQIRAYANDSLGNIGANDTHTNITITSPPNITSLNYPAEGATLSQTNVDFNFTVVDNLPPIANCTLWGNFSPGGTWAANKTIFNVANNVNTNITINLANGLYKWSIQCFDSDRESAWYLSNYTLRLDNGGPTTSIDYPRNFNNITLSSATYTVNASASDLLSNVDTVMFYYRKNATDPWQNICSDSVPPYACDWSIGGLAAGKYYQIRAFANDSLGNIGANDTHTNITLTTAPSVTTLNYPGDGASLRSTQVDFNFTVIDDYTPIANCTLWGNFTGSWAANNTVINVANNTRTNITLTLPNGLYLWDVQCTDSSGGIAWYPSNYTVKFDTAGPTTSINNPQNFTNITGVVTYIVDASVSDLLSNIDTVMFYYRKNASDSWQVICSVSTFPYECDWGISSLTYGRSYQIRVFTNDTVGNIGLNDTHTNITISNPPNITSLNYPANGAGFSLTKMDFNFTVVDNLPPITNCTLWGNFSPSGTWAANKTIFNVANNVNTNITINLANGLYMWDIRCIDGDRESAWYPLNYTLTMDTAGPTTLIDSPQNFTSISLAGETYTLSASASDTLSAIDSIKFYYRKNATNSWQFACTASSEPYECDWNLLGLTTGTSYQVLAFANDTSGNIGGNDTHGNITITSVDWNLGTYDYTRTDGENVTLLNKTSLPCTPAARIPDVANHYSTIDNGDGTWTTTYQPNGANGKDAWISSASGGNDNHGACIYTWSGTAGTASAYRRGLFWFNISKLPDNITITESIFSWYAYTIGSGTVTTNISRLTEDWVEGSGSCTANSGDTTGTTWATYNGINNWAAAGGTHDDPFIDQETPVINTWTNFTITSLVEAWYDNTYPNYGLIAIPRNEGSANTQVYSVSSDNTTASVRPKLTVTYQPGCYYSDGNYTSRVYDADSVAIWNNISWGEILPAGTDILIWTHICDDASCNGEEQTWDGPYTTSAQQFTETYSRYFQYRVAFNTSDSAKTPYLTWVTVNYTYDTYVPIITTLSYPPNSANLNSSEVDFNFTVVDNRDPLANCTLWGNFTGAWAANKTIFNVANNTKTNITLTLADGQYHWNINCYDHSGNSGWFSSNYTLRLDAAGPITLLGNPQNFTNITGAAYTVDAGVSDTISGVDTARFYYRRNASDSWQTICNDLTFPYSCTWDTSAIPEGNSYQVRVYANDSVGNLGNNDTHINVTLDRTPPSINLMGPANNSEWNISTIVIFTYNVSDTWSDVANCSLIISGRVNGSAENTIAEGMAKSFSRNLYYNQTYSWSINCTDAQGLENSSGTYLFSLADRIAPQVVLVNPASWDNDPDGNVTFQVRATDNYVMSNCSLYTNISGWTKEETIFGINNNSVTNFTKNNIAQNISFVWNVLCIDYFGNFNWAASNRTVFIGQPPLIYQNYTISTALNILPDAPVVSGIDIDSPISLIAGGIIQLTCNATIYDPNGYLDIISANSTLYDPREASSSSPDNFTNHYSNTSCRVVNYGTYTKEFECGFSVKYYANNGSWSCNITGLDSGGLTGTNGSVAVIDPLYAIDVTSIINYGDLLVGESSTSDEVVTITNLGNVETDLAIKGYGANKDDGLAMNCSSYGNISVGFEKFSLSSGQLYADMTYTLTSGYISLNNFNLGKQIGEGANSTKNMYWKLLAPVGTKGICQGTVVFSAQD